MNLNDRNKLRWIIILFFDVRGSCPLGTKMSISPPFSEVLFSTIVTAIWGARASKKLRMKVLGNPILTKFNAQMVVM